MAHATYRLSIYGYAVAVFDDEGNQLEHYTAGSHPGDSQVYIPNGLSQDTLARYARQTARAIMNERGLVGRIRYDKELSLGSATNPAREE